MAPYKLDGMGDTTMEIAQLLPPQTVDSDPTLEFEEELEQAAHALDVEAWVLQRLKHPEREITVNLPLVRDDGAVMNVTGYRVQHSRADGPSIGPVIISPSAQLSSLRATSMGITLQSALLGLRMGGAAGALVVDHDHLSERDLRHAVKDYVAALHENTGPLRDVVACGGNEYIARWMDEANTQSRGQSEPAAITGKSGDAQGLSSAWAKTTIALIRHGLRVDAPKAARIALQGFGQQARALASALHAQGATIVGLADRSGGLMRESGVDVAELEKHAAENRVIFGYPGAEASSNADVLESECDVLVLAAAQRQIGIHNAGRIRAKLILELAEGAITSSAATALARSCTVIPHLLAASAQLAIWYHEWQHGLTYSATDPAAAETEATGMVIQACERAKKVAASSACSLRRAAMMVGMERLATALRKR